jgi:hypothetical protein
MSASKINRPTSPAWLIAIRSSRSTRTVKAFLSNGMDQQGALRVTQKNRRGLFFPTLPSKLDQKRVWRPAFTCGHIMKTSVRFLSDVSTSQLTAEK